MGGIGELALVDDTAPEVDSESRGTMGGETVPVARRSLTVGAVDDPAEREADDVAARVVAALASPGPAAPAATDENRLQRSPLGAAPPRHVPVSGGRVQRFATAPIGAAGGDVSTEVSERIARASGRGRSLEPAVRRSMEDAFGRAGAGAVDFSGVNVHAGAESRSLNEALGARAFTLGRDIHFRDSVPDAGSASGQRLLAHELTHIVQGGATAQRVVRRDRLGGTVKGGDLGNLKTRLDATPIADEGPDNHSLANNWMEGIQGGTGVPGAFTSANDYRQGLADSHGKNDQGQNRVDATGKVGSNQVGQNLVVAAGVVSVFDLVVSVSQLVQAVQDENASKMDVAGAGLGVASGVTSASAGIASIQQVAEGGDAATAATKAANSVLAEIAGMMGTIQAGFSIVKQIVELTGASSDQETAVAAATMVKSVLEAGKGVVDTVNAFMAHLGTVASGALQAAPAIGIAINCLDMIVNGINMGFAYCAWSDMQTDKRESKELLLGRKAKKSAGLAGFLGGHESSEGVANEVLALQAEFKRAEQAQAAAQTKQDTSAAKVDDLEDKVKALKAKKKKTRDERAELKQLEAELKVAKRLRTSDAKQADAAVQQRTAAEQAFSAKGGQSKAVLAEEYLVSKNLQYIAAKRIRRGLLNVSLTLPAIAGDIAILSGAGAAVGAGLKGASGGAKLLAVGVRMGKQAYHDRAGDSKSTANKTKTYEGLIRAMTQHAIDAGTDEKKQQKATREIVASGMTIPTMTAYKDQPEKLHGKWIDALKKR